MVEPPAASAKRHFPCRQCGANLEFKPGSSALVCPYCGTENLIPEVDAEIEELDFEEAVRTGAKTPEVERLTVHCDACGATTTFDPNVVAGRCAFCDAPIVAKTQQTWLIEPKSLLPFHVSRDDAAAAFKKWLQSRWFAPNDLKQRANRGNIDGVYIPFWTYDCNTTTRYSGQRGEDYFDTETYTTVENGQRVTRTRQVVRTRWYPARGTVRNTFDDVLVLASASLPRELTEKLEPWDLAALAPYDEQFLSGFRAEVYQTDVKTGFERAKQLMEPPIRSTIAADIGGDRQQIHSVQTRYADITYKHVLLPIWISAYRYKEAVYRFLVNARTGEVQGERPWSAVKITLAVIAGLIVALVIYLLTRESP